MTARSLGRYGLSGADQQRLAEIIDETLDTFEPALLDVAANGNLPEAYRAPLLNGLC